MLPEEKPTGHKKPLEETKDKTIQDHERKERQDRSETKDEPKEQGDSDKPHHRNIERDD